MQTLLEVLLGFSILVGIFGAGTAVLMYTKHDTRRFFANPISWIRDTFTLHRWLTNPFKLFGVGMLQQASVWQLMLGNTQSTIAGELDLRSRIYLTICVLIGSSISFYGLHLRDWEESLWVEISGYLAAIGMLFVWIFMVYVVVKLPNTSYGLNLTEGFALASVVRTYLVLKYKRALRHPEPNLVEQLAKVERLRRILGGDL